MTAGRLPAVMALVAGLGLAASIGGCGRAAEPTPADGWPDLSAHPIYSAYDFGQADSIIDVGMQPFWLPTCLISEAMRRDAVLRGQLAEQGLEIRFHPFLKGADVNVFLEGGDLEVGFGGDMPALTAVARSGALVAALTQQGFCAIVARHPMLLTELRGRRIGYASGSSAHYALLQALAAEGLQQADVRLVSMDVTAMPQALARGEIDAFSAWEPTPTIAFTRFDNLVVIHRSLSAGYLYFARPFAERHPEAVRDIVAAVIRALRWFKYHEVALERASGWALEAGQSLTGRPPVLAADQYMALTRNDLVGTGTVGAIPAGHLTADGPLSREFTFLQHIGAIPATAEWEQVRAGFDRTIVERILSAGDTYARFTFEYADE